MFMVSSALGPQQGAFIRHFTAVVSKGRQKPARSLQGNAQAARQIIGLAL
jgi:hypothetical protein